MNRRASVASVSKSTQKIARSYLQLQRLRQLVQEAERSLAPHGVNITSPGSRINLHAQGYLNKSWRRD
jgi:hypothetical protein